MIGQWILQALILFVVIGSEVARSEGFKYHLAPPGGDLSSQKTVIGCMRVHTVAPVDGKMHKVSKTYLRGYTSESAEVSAANRNIANARLKIDYERLIA
jgi:hypothetical protein